MPNDMHSEERQARLKRELKCKSEESDKFHYCSRNLWATYGEHMGHIWGPGLQHMGLFSTYGEEKASGSATYGEPMGHFFKHMGLFSNKWGPPETYGASLNATKIHARRPFRLFFVFFCSFTISLSFVCLFVCLFVLFICFVCLFCLFVCLFCLFVCLFCLFCLLVLFVCFVCSVCFVCFVCFVCLFVLFVCFVRLFCLFVLFVCFVCLFVCFVCFVCLFCLFCFHRHSRWIHIQQQSSSFTLQWKRFQHNFTAIPHRQLEISRNSLAFFQNNFRTIRSNT